MNLKGQPIISGNATLMQWDRLVDDRRLGLEDYVGRRQTRNDFQRDYDRMIFSSPFRRLQNKTQVFPLPGHVFVHNRLTHSLEVSSVGRSMANETAAILLRRHAGEPCAEKIRHIGDIVAAACLCHDIGNPPFGHSGEKTIGTYFSEGDGRLLQPQMTPRQWADLVHFEGNANSLRLLTHRFHGRREGGFAMTYSTLAAIVKYPYSSLHAGTEGKFGFFESEEDTWRKVASTLGIPEVTPGRFVRHPLVYLLEAADDICYQIMDLEDAHRLKIVNTSEVEDLLLGFFDQDTASRRREVMHMFPDPNERISYLRSGVIGELVEGCAATFADSEHQILCGEFEGSLIANLQPRLRDAYAACSALAYARIYNAPEVVDVEIAGNHILTSLLNTLVKGVTQPEKHLSQLLLERIPQQYETDQPSVYGKVQSVLDHISGMTDIYALDLYRRINGHSLPNV